MIAAALSIGTAILLVVAYALWHAGRSRQSETSRELRELVSALARERTRPVEGRLTGGFPYAPPPPSSRGDAGTARSSPDVRIALVYLEKLALSRPVDSAARYSELGVAHLIGGDLDDAVDAFESAIAQEPNNAKTLTNLSAAYLARGRDLGHAEDWPKALAAAERAITLDPTGREAYFNRALALEGLSLLGQAEAAWSKAASVDPSSMWTQEGDGRRRQLEQRPRGIPSITDQDAPDRQVLRERIEDDLLAQWGRGAATASDPDRGAASLNEALRLAEALAAFGGDSMARDATRAIRNAIVRHDTTAVQALARGHAAYGLARQQFLNDRLIEASQTMSVAAAAFRRVNSPYALWAPIFAATATRMSGSPRAALHLVEKLSLVGLPSTYYNVHGRVAWTAGAAYASLGQYDRAGDQHRLAARIYEEAGEWENRSLNQVAVAEAAWFLGNRREAWARQVASVQYLDRLRLSTRRNVTLFAGAYFSLGEGLPEAALHFQDALVHDIDRAGFAFGRPSAYMQRARIHSTLGDTDAALADLATADMALLALTDLGVRERSRVQIRATRAEVLKERDPKQALREAEAAIAYYQRGQFGAQLARLYLLEARILEGLGNTGGAADMYQRSIKAFEQDRSRLSSMAARMQAFDEERGTFRELLRFEAVVRRDLPSALRAAEQGRARLPFAPMPPAPALATRARYDIREAVDPTVAGRQLSADVAVIYYAALDDRVLGWIVTSDGNAEFSTPIPSKALRASVDRIHRMIADNAGFAAVSAASRSLADAVLAPAIRHAGTRRTLVFVPDGALIDLPFSAMPDADGRPLVMRFRIAVAPSLTALLASSARLTGFVPDSVLAIGDGHDARATGIVRLPLADAEAAEIAGVYPESTVLAGAGATRSRFFATEHAVVHFGGHTLANPRFPLSSRMLLAPDPDRRDNGMLIASDIADHRFTRTGVVVLATCDSAVGRMVEGEGMVSVAGAFLAAGVPSVVATLWPIDDDSHVLLTTFHEELRKRRDAAAAVRAAQLAVLEARGMQVPVRVWGAFVALGGLMREHSR